jgi:DNA replicative helicase MCM subunit Mcm2 (Cdc46/Mcm family)
MTTIAMSPCARQLTIIHRTNEKKVRRARGGVVCVYIYICMHAKGGYNTTAPADSGSALFAWRPVVIGRARHFRCVVESPHTCSHVCLYFTTELFQRFVQEHTLLIDADDNSDDEDDDDDDGMAIPVAGGGGAVRRVPCYPPHLQRIKDRRFYPAAATTTANNDGAPHRAVASSRTFIVEVPLSELLDWDPVRGGDLVKNVTNNTLRYHDVFCKVLDAHIARLNHSDQVQPAETGEDIWHEHRLLQQEQAQAAAAAAAAAAHEAAARNPYAGVGNVEQEVQQQQQEAAAREATLAFPAILMRRYELRILPVGRRGTTHPFVHQHTAQTVDIPKPVSLRNVRAKDLGHLVTVTGMVVRASDVKPAVMVATYACDACGAEIYQVVPNTREFMPQSSCPSAECGQRNRRPTQSVHLQTRGSKFVKFQELKLQELPNQVPMGHVPRSMSVLCRGELTRQATPGDIVTVDGVFLPQRLAESGYKALKAGLIATTFLEAQNVMVHKRSYDDLSTSALSNGEAALRQAAVMAIATGPDPMGRLASSIAPEIFGHADIKRALLLQLVGGCTRTLPDGMRIRGDINICLMGDPGVAKSQLLKHVASIAPRGVYTTGKGSSGVGLTAAVTKDATTGEMALEGGALVLADRGKSACSKSWYEARSVTMVSNSLNLLPPPQESVPLT